MVQAGRKVKLTLIAYMTFAKPALASGALLLLYLDNGIIKAAKASPIGRDIRRPLPSTPPS